MGLLDTADWQAEWIGDARSIERAAANPPTGPHNGYHSELASSPNAVKWVAIDLGSPRTIPPGLLIGNLTALVFCSRCALRSKQRESLISRTRKQWSIRPKRIKPTLAPTPQLFGFLLT